MVARLFGDMPHVIRQGLGVLRRARNGKRVHEPARAVALVTIIDPRRIAGKRKLRHPYRLLHAIPYPRLPEYLRAIRADDCAPTGQAGTSAPPRYSDMVHI